VRDVSNGYHSTYCQCGDCNPYVPADKPLGYYTRRIEIGLTGLIIFAATVFIACY